MIERFFCASCKNDYPIADLWAIMRESDPICKECGKYFHVVIDPPIVWEVEINIPTLGELKQRQWEENYERIFGHR